MPKKVEDIVKGNKRSVRDIPIRENRSSREDKKAIINVKINREKDEEKVEDNDDIEFKPKKANVIDKKNRSGKSKRSFKVAYTFFGAVIVVATLGYFISLNFSKAIFDVYKKEIPVVINGTYIGKTENTSTSSIQYRTATFTDTVSLEVDATEKNVGESFAIGSITLYNSYNMTGQKLLAGTRLSDDLVHVYRLNQTVTVPGYKKINGQIIPGKLLVKVTADKAGADYNVTLDSKTSENIYKVVAYKGTDKYVNIYGKLASSLNGGSKGTMKVVDKATMDKSLAILKKLATDKTSSKISSQIKESEIVFTTGGIAYDFSNAEIKSTASTSANRAILVLPFTAKALVFDKVTFVKKVSSDKAVQSFEPFTFEASGIDKLAITLINEKDLIKETKKDIAFKLSGKMSLKAVLPIEVLKKDLAGQRFDEVTKILAKYKNVLGSGSTVQLVPPWASVVPNDPKRILININD
jgi:hypothetical protein